MSNGLYGITVLDGESPATYSFYIKAWALGGLSSVFSPILYIIAKCPIYLANMDELETINLSNHITWIGAPATQSTYTMNSPYIPNLPKCLSITSYEAVDESISGILSYPAGSCMTNPCLSWDINSLVAQIITFKIRATSSNGFTYDSS